MRRRSRTIRDRCGRRPGGVAVAVTVAALMLPALASALSLKPHGSTASKAHASATSFKAVLHAPNHHPVENKKWWIKVDVTRGKQKLSGNVYYRFLFDGTVVSHQPGHKFKNGLYKDALVFPAAAVGKPLTLQVVVKTKYGTKYLPWSVNTVA